ncbi:MAG: ABC transporter permease [Aggregatilineales bacterium]
MRRFLALAQNELRIVLSDRSIWINLVIIPIVLTFAVGLANGAFSGGGPPLLLVDVLDEDSSSLSAAFRAAIAEANPRLLLCPAAAEADGACQFGDAPLTAERADERLRAQTTLALVIIPRGFAESVAAGEPVTIIYRSNEDVTASSFAQEAVRTAAARIGGAQVAVTTASALINDLPYLRFSSEEERSAFLDSIRAQADALLGQSPVTIRTVQAQTAETASTVSEQSSGFAQSMAGMGSMYVLFAVLPAAGAFIRERKNWTMQRLATMPVSRAQILGGKLFGRFLLGMLQYTIVFIFGVLLGVRLGQDLIALLLLMMTFTLCVTALALALTPLLKTEEQAQGVALFLALTLAPLGGAWWPLEIVPSWMQTIGHISPIAWAMNGYRELLFFNGILADILLPLGVLGLMTAACFTFGVVRFRYA